MVAEAKEVILHLIVASENVHTVFSVDRVPVLLDLEQRADVHLGDVPVLVVLHRELLHLEVDIDLVYAGEEVSIILALLGLDLPDGQSRLLLMLNFVGDVLQLDNFVFLFGLVVVWLRIFDGLVLDIVVLLDV